MVEGTLFADFIIRHKSVLYKLFERIYLAVQLAQLVLVRHARTFQIVRLLL